MGESLESAGRREARTNSGDSILEIWLMNEERHGAEPTLAGVLEEVDIVQAIRNKRMLAVEAILNEFQLNSRD